MTMTLKQRVEEIKTLRDELGTVFEEAGPNMDFEKVTSIKGDDIKSPADLVAWVQEREEQLGEKQAELKDVETLLKSSQANEQVKQVLDLLDAPANAIAGLGNAIKGIEGDEKGFAELFFEKFDPREDKGKEIEIGLDLKTLFQTTAGWAPETTRTGRVVDYATRPVQVLDVIPSSPTSQAAVVYMAETTFTNAAAETAEGLAFPESTFALTEVSSPVRKISHFIPVTDEQLEDVEGSGGYLDRRLRFGLRQRADLQVIVGDGTPPNLSGITDRAGILTQAKGNDPAPDAVHKALTKVEITGRGIPDYVMMHGEDWQTFRLLRTADGIYIYGSPADLAPPMVWGLPVVKTEALSQGTALVGDFGNFSEISIKRGVTVKVSDSHDDYFVKGKQAIRADMRMSLQVYREAAFATVTGL